MKEALKLALEALEDWDSPVALPAIYAIKEALTQPDYRAVKTYHEGKPVYVSQPEQEPGAWIHNFIEGGISIGKRPSDLNRHPERWTALYRESKPCPTCEALARTVMLDQTSHDTKRPWVGLTDEEIDLVWPSPAGTNSIRAVAKAIEAKLKELNT